MEHEEALKEEVKYYQKLKRVADSQEIKDFFDFQIKTVAEKMLWAFTSGKDGDNVKSWEDFCKVRGEVIARLHPIQEVRSAEATEAHLKEQLDKFYNPTMWLSIIAIFFVRYYSDITTSIIKFVSIYMVPFHTFWHPALD